MNEKQQDKQLKYWQPRLENLPHEREEPKLLAQAPKVELSPLPKGLKHAFLGSNDAFPIITSSELSAKQDEKLINLLREHKSALGWTVADIKGISALICSHMIHLEEGAQPHEDAQKKLNP